MAEKLGVEGDGEDRIARTVAQPLQEVGGVLGSPFAGPARMPDLLVGGGAGDAMVFEPGEAGLGTVVHRPDVGHVDVESGVAVELPEERIAGVAAPGRPDQGRKFGIAGDHG